MKYQYYLVRLVNSGHTRCEKASGPREACKLAYGTVYGMPGIVVYKAIGTKLTRRLSQKRRDELEGPDGWLPLPMSGE